MVMRRLHQDRWGFRLPFQRFRLFLTCPFLSCVLGGFGGWLLMLRSWSSVVTSSRSKAEAMHMKIRGNGRHGWDGRPMERYCEHSEDSGRAVKQQWESRSCPVMVKSHGLNYERVFLGRQGSTLWIFFLERNRAHQQIQSVVAKPC